MQKIFELIWTATPGQIFTWIGLGLLGIVIAYALIWGIIWLALRLKYGKW